MQIHSAYTALLNNYGVYCSVSAANIWITSAFQIQITLAFRAQCNQQRLQIKGQGRWRDFNQDKWEGGTVSLSLWLAVNGPWHCEIYHPLFYLPFPPLPFLSYSGSAKVTSSAYWYSCRVTFIKTSSETQNWVTSLAKCSRKVWDIVHIMFLTHWMIVTELTQYWSVGAEL